MSRCAAFAAFLLLLIFAGCQVSKPGSVESALAKRIKRHVTVGDKDVKNPVAAAPEAIKEGSEHFQHHCQICHGLDGHATGVPFADRMSPPVPDLGAQEIQEYSDGQLHWIIDHGLRPSGMPSWSGILEDDEMWKIVLFIRNLPAKGSLGAPPVFQEEQEEHQRMEREKAAPPAGSKPPTHTHTHTHPG